jgi:hypothetical protein
MCYRNKSIFLVIGFFLLSVDFVRAVELLKDGNIIVPDRTSEVIIINGDLSEKVWENAPLSRDFETFVPGYGQKMGKKTEVWAAYDKRNLYFAFKCYDDPNKIETRISARDNLNRDDWVGILIDMTGSKQISYEFYVNPHGVQQDGFNSTVKGADYATDYVWYSAGKVTEEGWQAEIALPLEEFTFKSGKEVKMGVIFCRNIVNLAERGSWPPIRPGQTDFNCMTPMIYNDLKAPLRLQVLPNFTYSRDTERENAEEWDTDITKNIGAGIKYGVTSTVTVEATANPDFSQVESDEFQMEVNQRYPLFYEEKRPFFMEGIGVFDFGLVDGGMVTAAVHTRNIIDPSWAGKVSGNVGKMSFAVLAANDQSEGRVWQDGINPNEGKDVFWGLARGSYNIGSDNSLGFLYSGRYFAGSKNNVIGADLQYRFFKNARLNVSYLSTSTRESSGSEFKTGSGLNAMLSYSKKRFRTWVGYERYDDDFTMYSAFVNRTNFSRGILYMFLDLPTKGKVSSWLKNLQPFARYEKLHDTGTGMDDSRLRLSLNIFFMGDRFLRLEYIDEKEAWQGQLYQQRYFDSFGRLRVFKWLLFRLNFRYGDRIYYGPEEPFLGRGHEYKLIINVQPNARLSLDIELLQSVLHRKTDNQKFYTVDILNAQTTYRFNTKFFIRGAVRYNNFQKKLLTDFLASFTLIPGTVMHLGYGSLYERKMWLDGRWVPGTGGLINMRNGLFFKVSYLWKFK